jgi:hypothetical protein
MGPSIATAFCGAVKTVTGFLNLAAKTTPGALGVGVGVLLLIVLPLSLTKWRPVRLEPLGRPRALGQLLLASGRLYWRHGATLMLIALTSLLILAGLEGLELLIREALGAKGSGLSFSDSGITLTVSTPGGFGRLLVGPIASAAVIAFVRNLQRRQDVGFAATWSAVLHRLWRLLVVALVANILVILLLVTIIGIPYAIKKFVDWQFAQQEILFEDRSIRDALRGSTRVVKGHWWRTAAVAGTLWLLSQIPGPALGFALVFTTVPVGAVNLIGAVVFALLLPLIQIGRTLLYLDLRTREARETVPAPIAVAPAGAG